MPENNAIYVNHFAALSAKSCVFDLEFCASCTNLITCDKYESFAPCVTVTFIEPLPLIEPAMTLSFTFF